MKSLQQLLASEQKLKREQLPQVDVEVTRKSSRPSGSWFRLWNWQHFEVEDCELR